MSLIHDLTSNNLVMWEVGKYTAIAGMLVAIKARPHLPHRHTGYVSMSGHVWNCSVCGKAPKDLDQQLREVVKAADGVAWRWPLSPEAMAVARQMGVTRPRWTPDAWARDAHDLADDISEYQAKHPIAARITGVRQVDS